MNGAKEGDEEGEVTFIGGRGETVIDYVLGDREAWERVGKLKVGGEIDSDHRSLTVRLEGRREKAERERREKGKEEWRRIEDWSDKAKIEFGEKTEEEVEKGGVDEELEELIRKVKERVRVKRRKKGEGDVRKWWDGECRRKKKEVRRLLLKWRKGLVEKEIYMEGKKEYKRLCDTKKEGWNKELLKEAREAKTQEQVWKVINKERKRRVEINREIKIEEWEEYFRKILGGAENKIELERGEQEGEIREEREKEKEEEEEEISWEEMEKVIRKLKKRKAAGEDGLKNEVWIWGGKGVKKKLWEICRRVWKGEGFPERWKEGIITPVAKKRGAVKVEDHRGVTLLSTAYKIYASILAERLEKEIEEKELVPESQAGFRKGRGVIDNIYCLNYLVGREIGRGRKVVAALVDLKSAFDSVDRRIMGRKLEEGGVSKNLRERISEIYKETKSVVRINEDFGKGFWTTKGVRQGCPLSPLLFNIMIGDIEEKLGKDRVGGVRVGGEKMKVLAYADDLVILAEEEEGMRWLLKRLEKYCEEKGLEVNTRKTKIIRFGKGGGRGGKIKWWWKGMELEEVKEVSYLGYRLKRNGGQEAQVRERVKKAMGVMGQVWGIGKRRFGGNWKRRMDLFDWLVGSVLGFGAEVWGWKEWEEVERLQERYMRWVLGIDGRTPGYMIREEGKREKLRTKLGRRAIRYEERLEKGGGSKWVRKCWEEIKKRGMEGGSVWEKQRKTFYEERGVSVEWVRRKRVAGEEIEGWLKERDIEIQAQERFERVKKSRWNRWYKEITTLGLPRYLSKGRKEESMVRIARFRLGSEMREGRYWEGEEKRRCRLCGWEVESWEHVVDVCMGEGRGRGREEIVNILTDDGKGENWMKRLQDMRRMREGERGEKEEGKGTDVDEDGRKMDGSMNEWRKSAGESVNGDGEVEEMREELRGRVRESMERRRTEQSERALADIYERVETRTGTKSRRGEVVRAAERERNSDENRLSRLS